MKLFKYKSLDHIDDVIINKRLWCSRYDALNDPMEWAFTSDSEKNEIEKLIEDAGKERWRICCLSKSEQYGLMWSMYGDNHKGVCIEVEIDEKNDEFCNYENIDEQEKWFYGDVKYINEAQSIDKSRADLKHVLWNKSKQWEHEQEVRFVRNTASGNDGTYFPVKINAIYLGKRMDKDEARNMKMLCDAFDVKWVDLSDPHYENYINYWNDCKNKPF